MASEVSQQRLRLLNSGLGSSYNISFNFSSIFTYPSRFLAKIIHKGGSVLAESDLESTLMDATTTTTLWIDPHSTTSSIAAAASTTAAKKVVAPSFPGPMAFFSSGYLWGLLIMGILMHRIDNIFVPTAANTIHRHRFNHRYGRSFMNLFLPIDVNRTATRLAIHLPTIYLMCRVLLLWLIMLFQTADFFPWKTAVSDSGNFNLDNILYRLGTWCASWETQDVCWHTFCAICAAFCIEGFVKSLDGNGRGFGFAEHMQANTSPFNLVGYAFLLHIYSSPLTHAYKPHQPVGPSGSDLLPSRPDIHVIITLSIPLLQLTLFHILSVRKKWSRHRLLPTALASVLSLTHFHTTLIRYMTRISSSPSSSTSASLAGATFNSTLPAYTYTPHYTTHGYPILNYVPNVFETFLISTIVLTIFLNTITQLLLTGRVDKPLLGLGIGTGAASEGWMEMIPWDEDFGVVLLRVGTASLEATGLRGWGNEVGSIIASSSPVSDPSAASPRKYGSIRLTRTGVLGVSPGTVTHANGKRSGAKTKAKTQTKLLTGWNNEVRDIDLGSDEASSSRRRRWGMNGVLTFDRQWFTELYRFVRTTWSVVFGAMRVGWEVLRGRRKLFRRHPEPYHDHGDIHPDTQLESSTRALHRRRQADREDGDVDHQDFSEEEMYLRFLRGENISDDDQDYDSSEADGQEDGEEDEEEDEREDELETVQLYADLADRERERESTPGVSTASTLLAHMSYAGSSPLTRRRYGALQTLQKQGGLSDGDDSWSDLGADLGAGSGGKSGSSGKENELDEARRNCVICTVEARVIICWPCRCLSMCDSCRESLAARSSASKHRCPCCRRGVEGYSRIYIP